VSVGAGRAARDATAAPLAEALASAGTELVFGVPGGGSNLDVIGAAETAGCRFVLAHGETAAGIMAGVVGELTGRPGACVVTRGPGAASAVNAVAQAWLDRQPLVLLTDCVSAGDLARVSHQRLDHQSLFGPITKASVRCRADDTRLADLVALTVEGRPGPVHIDVDPHARSGAGVDDVRAPPHQSAAAQLDAVRTAMRAARRPAVVVGVGAVAVPASRRIALRDALHRFLADAHAPALTTYKARGVVSDLDPSAAGVATGATIESDVLDAADLIVGVGLDPVELIPAPWPYAAPVVLLGGWPIDDSTYFGDRVAAELTGDLATTLEALAGELDTAEPAVPAQRHRALALNRLREAEPSSPAGLTAREVASITQEAAGPGAVATVDAGAHMLVAVPQWETRAPGDLLVSSGLATMGFALPAAIGAALVHPGRRVVCLTGDGGLGMTLAELETLARLRLDVLVVVFNDSTLSLIAIKQRSEGHGGVAAVRYRSTDYAAIARGCGLTAETVRDAAALRRAARAACARRGPTLLDVTVDPSGYGAVLHAIRGGASHTTISH
jgi:acetolactate synthase-1/2/3 large subunit